MVHVKGRRLRAPSALAAIVLAAALSACSKHDARAKPPASASLVGTPKALFLASAAASGTTSLHEVTTEDAVVQVEFRDEDGRPLDVQVAGVTVLSREWVLLSIYQPSRDPSATPSDVLLRISDGKLFDAKALSVKGVPQVKRGNTLYSIGYTPTAYGALLRTDLTTMRVEPMSNPQYDQLSGPFVVDHQGNVRAGEHDDTGYLGKIFFADNRPPVVDAWRPNVWTDVTFCDTGGNAGMLAAVYGEDDRLYAVCADDVPDPGSVPDPFGVTTRYQDYFVRQVSFTEAGSVLVDSPPVRRVAYSRSVPAERRIAVSPWNDLRPRTRRLVLSTGFFTVAPVPAGGISVAWTDLPVPDLARISGEYGYWQEGTTVYRLRLAAGATREAVLTAPTLISWEVAGGVVIFTKYLTGTSIGTYRVDAPGAEPVLVSSSDMQVQQIQEL